MIIVKINLQESLVLTYKRAYLFLDDHFLNPGFGLFVKINLQESLVIHRWSYFFFFFFFLKYGLY